MSKAKKRKVRRNITMGVAHIRATFNNTTVTITDNKGDTLCWASAGTTGFKGSILSTRLQGEYRMTRHLAAGAALDAFKVNTKASKDNWHGGFDYYYWGPQIYLTARY